MLQGGTGPAAGALIEITVGAEKDGRLVAIEGTYHLDAGGLPGMGPSLLMYSYIRGRLLCRHAEEMVRYYRLIRRSRRELFNYYLQTLPPVRA